jgi:hypothetical protein
MRRFLALLVLGGGSLAAADPVELVRQLADKRFAAREAAAKELLKLGAAALPAVRDARDATDDPALRERTDALIPRLERIADSERILRPIKLKLDYKDVPLSQGLEDLKQRTGIPLQLLPERVANLQRPVTLKGEFTPWEAVERFRLAANLVEDHRNDLPLPKNANTTTVQDLSGRRTVYSAIPNGGAAFYTPSTAPILLADGPGNALPANRSQTVRVLALPHFFPGNTVVRGSGTVNIHLDVAPLPNLNWIGTTKVRVLHAEDEDGRPVFGDERSPPLTVSAFPYQQIQWGGGIWMQMQDGSMSTIAIEQPGRNPRLAPVTLRTDDRSIKTLRKFSGIVVGEVFNPSMPIVTIDDLPKSVGRVLEGPNGMKLSIVEYREGTSGDVIVKLRAEMPQFWQMQGLAGLRGRFATEDMNIGSIQNRLKFTDSAGKPCRPQQLRASYSGSNWTQTYESQLRFPSSSPPVSAGPPVKVVLTGTRFTTVEVPFSFENVRLP